MWPFKRRSGNNTPPLVFASGEEFLDFHCSQMDTRLHPGLPLVALVLEGGHQFGAATSNNIDENGIQTVVLRVASRDGGFTTIARTAAAGGHHLEPGDVVAWVPGVHLPKIGEMAGDERSGWMGSIIARLALEIDPVTKAQTVLCHY